MIVMRMSQQVHTLGEITVTADHVQCVTGLNQTCHMGLSLHSVCTEAPSLDRLMKPCIFEWFNRVYTNGQ